MLILFPSMVYFWFVHCLCNYSYFFSEYETLGNSANLAENPKLRLARMAPTNLSIIGCSLKTRPVKYVSTSPTLTKVDYLHSP